jgi:hypothetical protein
MAPPEGLYATYAVVSTRHGTCCRNQTPLPVHFARI